jgi:hypothetical protein
MAYCQHVFISYRREVLWTPWTRDHFRKLLTAYLQQELGERPEIFVDELVPVSADYVKALGERLGTSMVLVAILSGDYFISDWCLHELDLMLERNGGNPGLVIPVVVHDCDVLPDPINRIQRADFKNHRITHMNEKGDKYEQFSLAVRDLAPEIVRAIRTAPPFQPTWPTTCIDRFNQVYDAARQGRRHPPSHFIPPPPPSFIVLPRLVT